MVLDERLFAAQSSAAVGADEQQPVGIMRQPRVTVQIAQVDEGLCTECTLEPMA